MVLDMVSTHPTGVQNSGSKYLPQESSQNTNLSPNQQLLPLTAKINSYDCLEIGGCDVTNLVQQFGSPLYILDETHPANSSDAVPGKF